VETAHNLLSLRCLSVIRNCAPTRVLCTRQQFFYDFSLLKSVLVFSGWRIPRRKTSRSSRITEREHEHFRAAGWTGGELRLLRR
jgi:hypothetical protein